MSPLIKARTEILALIHFNKLSFNYLKAFSLRPLPLRARSFM